ncbi:MAG: hypothetical protein ACRYHA_25625 [Janthinobacterium lividum]
MNPNKTLQQKQHAEARVFIRLHMSEAVARGASHIRSKRPASLQAGIDEIRREYAADFGEATVAAFLECIEMWLNDRGNAVAAAALRLYMETATLHGCCASGPDATDDDPSAAEPLDTLDTLDASQGPGAAFPLLTSTVSMYVTDHFPAFSMNDGTGHVRAAAVSHPRAAAVDLIRPVARAETRPRVPGAMVASRSALRSSRSADNDPATHSYRSSRSR